MRVSIAPVAGRSSRSFTYSTLGTMSRFARDGARDYDLVKLARSIALPAAPDRDQVGQAAALLGWVSDSVCYVFDPQGVELVQEPRLTWQQLAGDCDDMATLLAALLGALGIDAGFRAVATEVPGQFDHVYALAGVNGKWMPADATVRGAGLGWQPPHVSSLSTGIVWD